MSMGNSITLSGYYRGIPVATGIVSHTIRINIGIEHITVVAFFMNYSTGGYGWDGNLVSLRILVAKPKERPGFGMFWVVL